YRFSQGIAEVLDLRGGDIYYTPLPLFHIAGQWAVVYAALQVGATVVLKDRFSVSEFWADIRQHSVNVTLLMGVMCSFLHRRAPQLTAGSNPLGKGLVVPLLPGIREFESRFNVRVATMYGSTECGAVLRGGYHDDGMRHFVLHDSKSC